MKGMIIMARTDILEHLNKIKQWIDEGQSKAYMARQLDCSPQTIARLLVKQGIEYKGNQSGKGIPKNRNEMTLEEYLSESKDIQSNKVRNKILKEGIKPHQCECCGNKEWMGLPIPLELHHKDGDRNHNELSNYELLCPNCHAFTDSYRGKNSRKDKCVETIYQLPKSE